MSRNQNQAAYDRIVVAARERRIGKVDPFTFAYIADNGRWILASSAHTNDDGRPHDLLSVSPSGTVTQLRITVNPALLAYLQQHLTQL